MPKLIGLMRLGRDCELRRTQQGDAVAGLSLAYPCGKPDQSGKRPTQWIDAALWGKRAESLAPYLLKGGLHCFTLDEVRIETFQRQDGSTGSKIAARVTDVELGSSPERQAAPPPPPPAPRSSGSGFDDMGDEPPF